MINPEEEWHGMPEFIQEDQSPYSSVTMHFRNQDDEDAFFVLIDQKRTKRKSYWHPVSLWRRVADKVYVEEGE